MMRRGFNAEIEAFRQEVEEFIRRHWNSAGPQATAGDEEIWRQALVARGWSVPGWPPDVGGTGWDATRRFIWQQSCAGAGVPGLDDAGIDIVGPLILQHSGTRQKKHYLEGIRSLEKRWCIAFAEPEAGTDHYAMTTSVRDIKDGFLINGTKIHVAGAATADWLCCFARLYGAGQAALFAVPARAKGVVIQPVKTLDGASALATVRLTDVLLSRDAEIARSADGTEFALQFITREFSTLSRGAVAAVQLQVLDEFLQRLDPADDLHARRNAAALALEALQALELRYLDALQRDIGLPFPLDLLRLKGRELLLQIGTLQMESFGYYALPFQDEMLLHNEGSIGPDAAAVSVRTHLTRQVTAIYEGGSEWMKDRIWRAMNTRRE